MVVKILAECNSLKCRHHFPLEVDADRIHRNRLVGLFLCPKCGWYDAPYIIPEQEKGKEK